MALTIGQKCRGLHFSRAVSDKVDTMVLKEAQVS